MILFSRYMKSHRLRTHFSLQGRIFADRAPDSRNGVSSRLIDEISLSGTANAAAVQTDFFFEYESFGDILLVGKLISFLCAAARSEPFGHIFFCHSNQFSVACADLNIRIAW